MKWQRLRHRANLNWRSLAQESSAYPPGLSVSWRMQEEKKSMNPFRWPPWTCTSTALASERSLRTATELLFRAFRENRQFSTASLSSWDKTLISVGLKNTGLQNHKIPSGTHFHTFDLKLVCTNWFSYLRGPQNKMTLKLEGIKTKKNLYSTVILKILLS